MALSRSLGRALLPLFRGSTLIVDDISVVFSLTPLCPSALSSLHWLSAALSDPKPQFERLGIVLLGQQGFDLLLRLTLAFQKLSKHCRDLVRCQVGCC